MGVIGARDDGSAIRIGTELEVVIRALTESEWRGFRRDS